MTELHDRLGELATVADAAPRRNTAGLARERARRYQRRRRAGTTALLTACAVVVLAVAGLSWSRAAAPVPADADAPRALPDRLYEPSRWLPGTADIGPLGSLGAVVAAERGSWTGGHPGVVGVSATTGEYRFLDLPGAELSASWALSPDGRRLAYWITGETRASPHVDSGPVIGVAVYDTVTGEVVRHPVDTDHGVEADVLAWAGPDELVFGYGQWLGGVGDPLMDRSSAAHGPRFVWDLATAPERLPVPMGTDLVAAGPDYVLVREYGPASRDGLFTEIRLDNGEKVRVQLGDDTSTSPVLDDTGELAAVVAGMTASPGVSAKNPNAVRAGPVGSVRRVPGSGRTFRVIAWVDPHHIAVHQRAGSLNDETLRTAVNLLDVRDGTKNRVMSLPGLGAPQVSTDLLRVAPREAIAPPRPVDPRVLAGSVVLTVILTGVGVALWRRRVQP